MTYDEVVELFGADGKGKALCPAHDDHDPSLEVRRGDKDGVTLLKCRSVGCSTEQITAARGITVADLFERRNGDTHRDEIITNYRYVDEAGTLLYEAIRKAGKKFLLRRPNGGSGWIWNVDGVRRVLYRLPEVVAAVAAGQPIYVVEGEKDCDRLGRIGIVATTNAGGAGKWYTVPDAPEILTGAEVIVVADLDTAGDAHARQVVASLLGKASSITVVESATGVDKSDVSDHLDAGHDLAQLVTIAPILGLFEDDLTTIEDWLAAQPEAPEIDVDASAAETEEGEADAPAWASLLVDGYTWLTTGTPAVTARWGDETQVLAATGQPTLIVGDSGAGKTTIAQHLALGALGISSHAVVLGLPVRELAADRTVLYLAADRPDQARLAMLRLVAAALPNDLALVDEVSADDEVVRAALARLVVWQGPPPTSLATEPRLLWSMARHVNAGLVITDSTKDMARQLSDDAVGAAVNEAHQHLVANGVDLVGLHHPRKRAQATPDGRASIDDVYGSAWLVNGAGSVLFLVTEPAGTELWQAKTPNGHQAELRYRHDTATGTLTVLDGDGVLAAVRDAGPDGIATVDVARWVTGRDTVTEAEIERFRRRLKSLEQTGLVAAAGQGRTSRWEAT